MCSSDLVAISGTNDPDGKIAKENAERKAKENREKEEKVKEKRPTKFFTYRFVSRPKYNIININLAYKQIIFKSFSK